MYTFAADSDKLNTLADEIDGNIAVYVGSEIDSTYTNIGGFGNDWSGEGYNEFKSGCEAYRGALESVPDVLNVFGKAFRTAATGVDELKTGVDTALDQIIED